MSLDLEGFSWLSSPQQYICKMVAVQRAQSAQGVVQSSTQFIKSTEERALSALDHFAPSTSAPLDTPPHPPT